MPHDIGKHLVMTATLVTEHTSAFPSRRKVAYLGLRAREAPWPATIGYLRFILKCEFSSQIDFEIAANLTVFGSTSDAEASRGSGADAEDGAFVSSKCSINTNLR